jgi:hypothetical protein
LYKSLPSRSKSGGHASESIRAAATSRQKLAAEKRALQAELDAKERERSKQAEESKYPLVHVFLYSCLCTFVHSYVAMRAMFILCVNRLVSRATAKAARELESDDSEQHDPNYDPNQPSDDEDDADGAEGDALPHDIETQ